MVVKYESVNVMIKLRLGMNLKCVQSKRQAFNYDIYKYLSSLENDYQETKRNHYKSEKRHNVFEEFTQFSPNCLP